MVTDQQVRRLFKLMQKALNLPSYRLEASKRQISTAQQPVDGWCARQREWSSVSKRLDVNHISRNATGPGT